MKSQKANNSTELEAKLLVYAHHPEEVLREIEKLSAIANYPLRTHKTLHLEDWYWDTPERVLQKNQIALRYRIEDGLQLITLKGAAKITSWGGLQRLEIEVPWSSAGFKKMVNEVKNLGIQLASRGSFKYRQPIEVFQNLGLEIIQARITQRKIKHIEDPSTRQFLAELAMDAVHYRIKNHILHHYEVEIESKHEKEGEAVRRGVTFLSERFGTRLRPWSHSKLKTGMALEWFFQQNPVENYVDMTNNLLPSIYDCLAEMFGSEGM